MHRSCLLYLAISIVLLSNYDCLATVLVTGDGTAPYTFTEKKVSAKVYDIATGILYVGRENSGSVNNIAKATRPIGNAIPTFNGIAAGNLTGIAMNGLALATYTGNKEPYVVAGAVTSPADETPKVFAVTYDGKKSGDSGALYDAAGGQLDNDQRIPGIAANRSFIFAAVPVKAGIFGNNNSGIAVVHIIKDTNLTLTQIPGSNPKAEKLDTTNSQVYINAGSPPTIDNTATLHWDEQLQRLYAGLHITTTNDSGGKAIVVGQQNTNGELTLNNITANSAIAGGNGSLIAANPGAGVTIKIKVEHLRTMHCSTGPSYLIVDEKITFGDEPDPDAHYIISLPLIDLETPTNAVQGTLAKIDAPLTNYRFTEPAINDTDLYIFDDTLTSPYMPLVGASIPPIAPGTDISDIEVIGDTVYISIAKLQSSTDDNGVFYSQALFGPDGKIARWTPWTKRAFPYRGFCDNTDCTTPPACAALFENKGVRFFAVDAVNGKVWGIDGATGRIVRLTAWDQGTCISELPKKVSAELSDGCYSVLDLHQGTFGFQGTIAPANRTTTEHRYALFGGCNKVVFARVSKAIPDDTGNIFFYSPQEVMTDFSSDTDGRENFLVKPLPQGAQCINSLEYSRRLNTEGDTNYFFAGTNTGLYVFAKPSQQGFNVTELEKLNEELFTSGQWHAAPEPFNNPIIAVRTTGERLYVLLWTLEDGMPQSKLYTVPFDTTISNMFTNWTLIAESGGDLPVLFTDIEPINNGTDPEQLLMSTNQGLYLWDSVTTLWRRRPENDTTMFYGISGISTPYPTTVWPFSVADEKQWHTYSRSSIYQISGPNPMEFVPNFFNANSTDEAFKTLYPITNFWSDGARRFFIVNLPCDSPSQNRLMVFPYDVDLWNVTNPADQVLRYDAYIKGTDRFFWVSHIGVTGILMAGTDRGVIALE